MYRLCAQEMYTIEGGPVFRIDYPTFNKELIFDAIRGYAGEDVTIDTFHQFWTIGGTSIYRVDTTQNTLVFEHNLNTISGVAGMATDANNIIWLAGGYLFSYDPLLKTHTNFGPMNYVCAGDLTFWNGDLYMTSTTNQIIKIDRNNPTNCMVHLDLNQSPIGLATIWNCVTGQTRTFAFGEGDVLEINFADKTYELATDLKIGATGATSPTEWHASLPFHKAIDTILFANPLCGMADGTIEFVPEASENGKLEFSLDGSVWQSSGLFTQLPAGSYSINIRGGSCKSITHTVVLDNMNAPSILAEALTPAVCKMHSGSITVLDTSNSTELEYSLDEQNWQAEPLFSSLATGWYTVTARDTEGCLSFADAYVRDSNSMYIKQILRNQDTAAVCAGTTVTLRALGDPAWSYAWSENGVPLDGLNSFLVFVAPSDTGWVRYHVTATDANGCTATTAPLDYWVFDCSILPNAFSPDGDGINDTFGITDIPKQWEVNLVVFDRWGNQVFQSSLDQKFWNGMVNNQQAPSDVYVYRLRITLPDGVFVEKKGEVTLFR